MTEELRKELREVHKQQAEWASIESDIQQVLLRTEVNSLWHSLAELSKLAPDSVRETLRATAVEVSGRASKICDGLGVDTDMYATADGNMARAKYSFHMASRLAGISGLMEYNNVELKDIKLAW